MNLLEIRDLKVEYRRPDGTLWTVLRVPQFDLDEGEVAAVKGASGSGKTTFLNIVAGILLPTRGSVRVLGDELTAMSEARRDVFRGQHIAFVFQTFNLLAGFTALENVVLGSVFAGDPNEDTAVTQQRALDLLKRVGLEERVHHRPHMLSAGEQQRVALARAMINRPRLILADEPTGSLDEANGREVLDLLTGLATASNVALLLVTHDPSVMGRFKRVVDIQEFTSP
jgi:ABC-type lipoprotein export system ATPase subunit